MDFCPAAAEQSNKKERKLNSQKAKGGRGRVEGESGRGEGEKEARGSRKICCCRVKRSHIGNVAPVATEPNRIKGCQKGCRKQATMATSSGSKLKWSEWKGERSEKRVDRQEERVGRSILKRGDKGIKERREKKKEK